MAVLGNKALPASTFKADQEVLLFFLYTIYTYMCKLRYMQEISDGQANDLSDVHLVAWQHSSESKTTVLPVCHLFGNMWKQGFKKTDGSPIQHGKRIKELISAMMLPPTLAVSAQHTVKVMMT